MTDDAEYQILPPNEGATGQITYLSNGIAPLPDIPPERREVVEEAAQKFLRESHGNVCVLLAGRLQSDFDDEDLSTENALVERCRSALGDPGDDGYTKNRTIDLVLDTLGGSLDSAYRTVLFLSQFTSKLRVYVPRRAKSAGTLIAIGAQELYLAPFAELGPLDTQIHDPRNPTEKVSALDCFQSVDYVRGFGIDTLKQVLVALGKEMKTGIPLSQLLNTATGFANSCTESMLANVNALDFGGWGRTLEIGQRYTQYLLRRVGYEDAEVKSISRRLVYAYTHHPFPIDIIEAKEIGLRAELMKAAVSRPALQMVKGCVGLDIAVGVWEASKKAVPQDGESEIPKASQARSAGHAKTRSDTDKINFRGNPAQEPAATIDSLRDEPDY
jgi:serine dehydrogenase proteinase